MSSQVSNSGRITRDVIFETVASRQWWAMILALAVVNFIAGQLGLSLAIPPGYATAIFPPSGIALACILIYGYRIWPGVWLGSFCINLSLSVISVESAVIAASIAVGSSLQAIAGAWLVRRFVGFPHPLDRGGPVIKLLGLGGPISCTIAATVGVTTLWWAGVVPGVGFLYNWWTWWVGDTLGVLVFSPLVLTWTIAPDNVWRRRRIIFNITLVALFIAVVFVAFRVDSWEQARIELEFSQQTDQMTNALVKNFDRYSEILHATAAFYYGSTWVDRKDFSVFANYILKENPGLLALEWIPRIADAQRDAYEATVRGEGYAEFQITELDAQKKIVRTVRRDEYFPIHYVEPYYGNELALGFDLGSEPIRRAALETARDIGAPVASGRIFLIQSSGKVAGILIFNPFYRKGLPHETISERRANLHGYLLAVIAINDVAQKSLQDMDNPGIGLWIEDNTVVSGDRLLYVEDRALPQANISPVEGKNGDNSAVLKKSVVYEYNTRRWTFHFLSTPDYLTRMRSHKAWITLATGLLFSALLGAFLLVVTGRITEIESPRKVRDKDT